jgi:hypothetical protein
MPSETETPTPPPETSRVPYKLDFFIAVISFLFPWGWSVSGFPPSIELACGCWALTLAAVLDLFRRWSCNTGKFRKTRWLIIFIVVILVVAFTWHPIANQYHTQQSAKGEESRKDAQHKQEISEQQSQIEGLRQGVSDLSQDLSDLRNVISTNSGIPSPVRLAMLDTEQGENSEQQKKLTQNYKVITDSVVGLQSLRSDRTYNQRMRELQKQQAEIQHARAEIQAQENQQQAEIQSKKDEEQARIDLSKKEQHLTKQCLDIFDYTIQRLYEMLVALSKDTGYKISFDFQGIPNIHNSNLVADGKIVSGTNIVSLGTNSEWTFLISTTSQLPSNRYDELMGYHFKEFVSLNITSGTRQSPSMLIIKPFVQAKEEVPDEFDQFTIQRIIQNEPQSNNRYLFSGYQTNIDEVLRGLLESLDDKYPLTIQTNTP